MSELEKAIAFRVPKDVHDKVKSISKSRGEDISDFGRRAILRELGRLGFLSEEEKKALELT